MHSEEINNCYNIIDHGINNLQSESSGTKAQAYWVYEEYRTERKPKNNFDFVVGQILRVTVETAPTEGIVQAAPLFDFRLAEVDHRQPLWKSYPHGKPADMSGVYVYYVERSGSRGEPTKMPANQETRILWCSPSEGRLLCRLVGLPPSIII